jgi:homoserine acetyltransferase
MKFPFYNSRDMVKAQYRLITETLGIPHLLAVTGISSGADSSPTSGVSMFAPPERRRNAGVSAVAVGLWC